MRLAALVSTAVLAVAGAAYAQAPQVSVAIGPKLQDKAADYGPRELEFLARDLATSVASRVAGIPGRYELILVDARPNRPTSAQLGHRPGLSMQSFGLGGATIEGAYIAPDGSRAPVSYRWYESDIAGAEHNSTWGDAQTAFDRLGARLAKGQVYAQR